MDEVKITRRRLRLLPCAPLIVLKISCDSNEDKQRLMFATGKKKMINYHSSKLWADVEDCNSSEGTIM
jgi:hypothetical protein